MGTEENERSRLLTEGEGLRIERGCSFGRHHQNESLIKPDPDPSFDDSNSFELPSLLRFQRAQQ